MYFANFPTIAYPFTINGKKEYRAVKDIAMNVRVRKEVLEAVALYDEYTILDGETPEHIADKFYGDPNLHWIIMLANLKFNYLEDFPMNQEALGDYVTEKYGSGHENEPHILFGENMHVDLEGNVVDPDAPFATVVSNFEYESAVNESKRQIKIIHPQIIPRILNEIGQLMAE